MRRTTFYKTIALLFMLCFCNLLYGQMREEIPMDLKKADTSVYYKYVFDSLSYCLVKFDYKQKVKSFKFINQYGANKVDTGLWTKKNKQYFSVDKNRIKSGGEIFEFLKYNQISITGFLDGKENGKEYFYETSGNLYRITKMINNRRYGLETHFFDDGRIAFECFNDSAAPYKFVDWYKTYFEDGQIREEIKKKKNYYSEVQYFKNRQVCYRDTIDFYGNNLGQTRMYYENGNLKYEANYSYGLLNGLSSDYDENGKLEQSINYLLGKKNGTEKIYNVDGILTYEIEYKDGKKISKKKVKK